MLKGTGTINFLVLREEHRLRPDTASGFSVPSVNTVYVGSTLRTFTRSVIVGVAFRIASGGSAAGTNSFSVVLMDTQGTVLSERNATTVAVSAGASAAGDTVDISLTDFLTLTSIGQAVGLRANAASLDKVAVLSDIVWRYRLL